MTLPLVSVRYLLNHPAAQTISLFFFLPSHTSIGIYFMYRCCSLTMALAPSSAINHPNTASVGHIVNRKQILASQSSRGFARLPAEVRQSPRLLDIVCGMLTFCHRSIKKSLFILATRTLHPFLEFNDKPVEQCFRLMRVIGEYGSRRNLTCQREKLQIAFKPTTSYANISSPNPFASRLASRATRCNASRLSSNSLWVRSSFAKTFRS